MPHNKPSIVPCSNALSIATPQKHRSTLRQRESPSYRNDLVLCACGLHALPPAESRPIRSLLSGRRAWNGWDTCWLAEKRNIMGSVAAAEGIYSQVPSYGGVPIVAGPVATTLEALRGKHFVRSEMRIQGCSSSTAYAGSGTGGNSYDANVSSLSMRVCKLTGRELVVAGCTGR
ncbi:uncharacterized protein BO97DRAFT_37755 [Aspergillus homomorphus CBS 101889]|uniref:Uncharacterized protein n=1 Tax=Aspergillus homomorphus (strain CBS 101889) TaxID=1450537 RepID=A0A395I166_ASPHC|nr:hypothetical protein BO97DRAFT_37755 [Aspergillus homomorphus CBS 101889]RAL13353.1 hypothetical protein BO97DRAFT_37755 [Aspergillus homomorphus CBS 101889]